MNGAANEFSWSRVPESWCEQSVQWQRRGDGSWQRQRADGSCRAALCGWQLIADGRLLAEGICAAADRFHTRFGHRDHFCTKGDTSLKVVSRWGD